jgi:ankyrin repeat protein
MHHYHFKIVSVRNPTHYPKIPAFMAFLILILSSIVTYGAAQSSGPRNPSPKGEKPNTPHRQAQYWDYPECVSAEPKPLTPQTIVFSNKKNLNLNGQTNFTNTAKQIVCRHISLSVLQDVTLSGTVDFEPYSSKEGIANKIPFDIQQKYDDLIKQAHDVHMIENEKLGNWLALQFSDMSKNKIALQKILVESTVHTMGLWLTLTDSHGKPTYRVNFYDPNFTVRCRYFTSDSLAGITQLSLKSLMEINEYESYYQEPLHPSVSMLLVLPNGSDDTCKKEPHLTKHTRIVTRETRFHLMRINFHEALSESFAELRASGLSKKELLPLLAAKSDNGIPGLFVALQNNNAAAIAAYFEVLKALELSNEALLPLLAAKREDGVPGLHIALRQNSNDAIAAYFEGLKDLGLSNEALLSLLAAKSEAETPGLQMVLLYDNKAAIAAYFKGLKALGLSNEELLPLLAAKREDGLPGLFMALQNNNAAAIAAYCEGLKALGLSKKELLPLLAAKSEDGLPGLFVALQNNNAAAIAAYCEGLKDLGLSKKELLPLLAAKSEDGVPGLYVALEVNSKAAIAAYFEGLEGLKALGLSNEALLPLLEATREGGIPGLFVALQKNNADAIAAYFKGLKALELSKKELLPLLEAKREGEIPGLYVALRQNSNDAIAAYLKGAKDLGLSKESLLSFIEKAPEADDFKQRSIASITQYFDGVAKKSKKSDKNR